MIDEKAIINRLHTVFGAHEKIPYSIRRDDESDSDHKPVNLNQALAALDAFSKEMDGEPPDEDEPPVIEFRAGTDAILQIYPGKCGGALCLFSEPYHQWKTSFATSFSGRWTRERVTREEQHVLLTKFFRRDYAALTQMLNPDPPPVQDWPDPEDDEPLKWDDEGGSPSREKYWSRIEEARAKRGELPELTAFEKELPPEACLQLCHSEERLSSEHQHQQSRLKASKIGRVCWSLVGALGITALTLQYFDYLPDKLPPPGLCMIVIVLGLVSALIDHVEYRTLLLGTAQAEKQRKLVYWTILVLVLLGVFAGLVVLVPALWGFIVGSGLLPVVVVVALAMTIGFVGIFYFQHRYRALDIKHALIMAAILTLLPVGTIALIAFQLFATTMAVMMLVATIGVLTGIPGLEEWVRHSLDLVAALVAATTTIAIAAKYVHGRYRAPSWESRLAILWTATMVVIFGSVLVCALVGLAVLAVVAGDKYLGAH